VTRILGLDYGTRRIGVAVSDPLGLTAGPLEVLDATAADFDERLRNLAEGLGVELIVVGLPVGLDGREGQAAGDARRFAERVAAATGLPVEMYDERFSTVTAERALLESGMRRERRREARDRVAAAVFLQAYLDGRR
jgi:putative Holliday junction resolvase